MMKIQDYLAEVIFVILFLLAVVSATSAKIASQAKELTLIKQTNASLLISIGTTERRFDRLFDLMAKDCKP